MCRKEVMIKSNKCKATFSGSLPDVTMDLITAMQGYMKILTDYGVPAEIAQKEIHDITDLAIGNEQEHKERSDRPLEELIKKFLEYERGV